jgi:hypothetical protein
MRNCCVGNPNPDLNFARMESETIFESKCLILEKNGSNPQLYNSKADIQYSHPYWGQATNRKELSLNSSNWD